MDNKQIPTGAVDADDAKILTFGSGDENQLFEIGSITKTFTATLLADAIVEGSLKISDPIPRSYQKSGTIISYQHLTTHTSGIIGIESHRHGSNGCGTRNLQIRMDPSNSGWL